MQIVTRLDRQSQGGREGFVCVCVWLTDFLTRIPVLNYIFTGSGDILSPDLAALTSACFKR
jgi:hypothetical protein